MNGQLVAAPRPHPNRPQPRTLSPIRAMRAAGRGSARCLDDVAMRDLATTSPSIDEALLPGLRWDKKGCLVSRARLPVEEGVLRYGETQHHQATGLGRAR